MKLSLELVGRGVEGKEQVSNRVEFGCKVEPGRRPTSSGSTRGWLEKVERGRGSRSKKIFDKDFETNMLSAWPTWTHWSKGGKYV